MFDLAVPRVPAKRLGKTEEVTLYGFSLQLKKIFTVSAWQKKMQIFFEKLRLKKIVGFVCINTE